jgi:ubiquinone/menaquinone biosynthesis C-methylase UbiE
LTLFFNSQFVITEIDGGDLMASTNRHGGVESSPVNSGSHAQDLFDPQAAAFEQRTGFPVKLCREITRAVFELGEARAGDVIVELGAGTGQIGQWFDEAVRYIGLDLSAGMLSEFRKHVGSDFDHKAIIRADANTTWPLKSGAARVVFSSRAVHLFEHEHVARELFRVAAHDGATFIIGRVERERESARARMSREMNRRLRQRGFEGRGGGHTSRKLFDACLRGGAKILEPKIVSRWSVTSSARQSIASWRSLASLGGLPVPAEVRQEILTELEAWAEQEFGGLDTESESVETYVLSPLRLK